MTTPTTDDLFVVVETKPGSAVTKQITIANFDAYMSSYLDSINTGWIADSKTWTYASTTTFTITGDYVTQFPIGTRIMLTNSTVKYFYVVACSYSAPNTTVTVCAGSTYALAAGAITSPNYSYAATPRGFPAYFSYTPTAYGLTTPVYNAQLGYFYMTGRIVHCRSRLDIASWAAQTGFIRTTLPVAYVLELGGVVTYFRASTSANGGTNGATMVSSLYGAMLNITASDAVLWEATDRVVIDGIWNYAI
jgi:hypothetical protein